MNIKFILFNCIGFISLGASDIFINEIDYDDPSSDNEEFVEICGLAGTYTNVSLDFINGNNNSSYDDVSFGDITISDEYLGYGFYVLVTTSNNTDGSSIYDHNSGVSSIQNGAPDGIYLKVNGTIVDGVSYEDSGDPLNSDMEQTNVSGESSSGKSLGRVSIDGSTWETQDRSPGEINNAVGTNDQLLGVKISGNAGFRMMSSPVSGTVYDDILDPLWIQGMTNGDVTNGSANIWTYDAANTEWDALSNLNTASLTAGQGFLVYVFSDTDNDGDDDLPVTLSVSGTVNTATTSISTTASQWNLLGNPFSVTIDADQLFTDNSNYTSAVYVWDDASSAYKSWNGSSGGLSNGLIAPYQGFWIQSGASGTSFDFTSSCKSSTAGTFYKQSLTQSGGMNFSIASDNYIDQTFLSFTEIGSVSMDNADAYKLLPMSPSDRIVALSFADGDGLDINNLPYSSAEDLSVSFDALSLTLNSDHHFETDINEIVLNWNIENLPEHISISLTNNNTGEMVYLDQQDSYTFNTVAKGSFPSYGSGPVSSYPLIGDALFTLTVHYSPLNNENDIIPSHFKLYQPYPNPFNPATQISFEIPTDGLVQLRAYDINGRLVDIILERNLIAGQHNIHWKPKKISSGIYLLQLNHNNSTQTQKITFMK